FEKGRIEDHRRDVADPRWAFMFGRLTNEIMTRDAGSMVSGTNTSYGDLAVAHRSSARVPIPAGFVGGTMTVGSGVFIPYDSLLRPTPGYIVPPSFWSYINRSDLFPGGWLHDIGLPLTAALRTTALKNGERHTISI